MHKTNVNYTAPSADLLVIRFEEGILIGSLWDDSTPLVDYGEDIDL